MKTPRELILERHGNAKQKLDALRREVLGRLSREQPAASPARELVRRANFGLLLWRELILPSRRAWTGIAAAWMMILAINFALRDPAPAGKVMVPAPAMMSFQEQQRLVNQLLADRSLSHDADRPKPAEPRPRSKRFTMSMT